MSDHEVARALYQDYLSRSDTLQRHRKYASDVIDATSGSGQTPVLPLATMGTNGGPLLCDVCSKPMLLEGGAYDRVYADEAWRRNASRNSKWTSWISGGMVVCKETNGTLRVYHGYPGSGCAGRADAADEQARKDFKAKAGSTADKLDLLVAYFKAEMPDKNNDAVLSDIHRVMFVYDPGLGINQP